MHWYFENIILSTCKIIVDEKQERKLNFKRPNPKQNKFHKKVFRLL